MKLTSVITAALAAAGASANMHKGYSQHRPEKHQVARTARMLQQLTDDHRALKNFKLAAPATAERAERQSVVGGATVSASKIASVTGTFRVPEARQPTRGPTRNNPITYGASFWVGIDGIGSCTAATLRAGVDVFWDPEGTSYNAWYQFADSRSVDFASPLNAGPGDAVRVTANAGGSSSSTNGTVSVTFENLSTGLQSTQTLDDDAAAGKLCRGQASWLVEDFVLEQSVGMPVPLADFDNVVFSDMAVTAAAGVTGGATPSKVDINTAVVVDMELERQGGKLTDCVLSGGAEVACRRIYGTA
ncbi:hypothetical protein RB598_000138 [Gaeumannomyces tritici]